MRTKRCDVIFPGIGRIAKATGAKNTRERDQRIALLRELYAAGKWEPLEAIRDGVVTVLEVVAAHRAGRLDRLWADVLLGRNLAATVEAWLPSCAKAEATRKRYDVSWRSFQRTQTLPASATIRDLERVKWSDLQAVWSGKRHDWKHHRGFWSRFLSVQLGVDHTFRKDLLATFPRAGRIPGRVPDLTPDAFWRIVRAMPEHVMAAPVAIVATGFRIAEFCRTQETDLRPLTKSVRVPGTKTDASEAVIPIAPELWPWIERAIPCPVGTWRLRELWRRACEAVGVEGVTPHDLRHCLGQWVIQAGEPEVAAQDMLRHVSADQTREYTKYKAKAQVAKVIGEILVKSHDSTQRKNRKRRERAS